MRNSLCLLPKGTQHIVAATIRTVFVQPDAATTREQWRRVADQLRARFPRVADLLDEAEDEVLAYLAFPAVPWPTSSGKPWRRKSGQIGHARAASE